MQVQAPAEVGVLDASEIPPTFSAPQDLFQPIIAGGDKALRHAVEGQRTISAQAAMQPLLLPAGILCSASLQAERLLCLIFPVSIKA